MHILAMLALAAAAHATGPAHVLPFDTYRNQVWFAAAVNGRGPTWLLFDSAAGSSTISRELTRRFGLENLQFATATVSGAGPARLEVPVLKGVTFSVDGFRWTPAQLPSIPHERISERFGRSLDGIIGKDLLQRYVAVLDHEARTLSLFEPAGYQYRGSGVILPIRLAEAPIFEAAIRIPQGRRLRCRLMMDSAVSGTLVFAAPYAREHGLPGALRSLSDRQMTVRSGGVGGQEENILARIEALEIGSVSIPRPVAAVALAQGASTLTRTDFDALIGMELLRRFRVIFDYSRQRIILEPNARLAEPSETDMSGLSLGWTGEHIVVSEVYPDTPASAAELRAGDRIVSLDGRAPASLWAVQCALKAGPGRVVRLGVERDGAGFEVKFTLRRLV
jgi:hypothetical protein